MSFLSTSAANQQAINSSLGQQKPIQPSRSLQGSTSTQPYRADLQTSFQGAYDPGQNHASYYGDTDSDVAHAQELTDILSQKHNDPNSHASLGVDSAATQAQLDAIKSRIALKNSLGSSIATNASREGQSEDVLKGDANQALASGVKNTQQNYNNRGLLYSGLREGGEQGVRAGVAGNLASGLSSTKREYSTLADQQKAAYAAVGQAQQAQQVQQATDTFNTVSANDIARQQAYQSLAGGVGQLAGAAYGAYNSTPSTTAYNPSTYSPTNNSSTLSLPSMGSQYSTPSTPSYGLLGGR